MTCSAVRSSPTTPGTRTTPTGSGTGLNSTNLSKPGARGLGLAEIQRRADEAGIGNARLNGVGDLAGHPQLAARGRWRQADSPVGPVPALLPPALALGWAAVPGRVPALGADTEAIRAEVGRSEGKTC